MSYTIHEGFWIDWTKGRWAGATITLSQRNGGLLLAFTATFVTLVMIRLWRIVSFICHQVCATEEAHDGLHFQRQLILRNVSSPVVAAKMLLLQTWYWRQGTHTARRILPWATLAVAYTCCATILALYSSTISDGASSLRLLRSNDCGIWDWDFWDSEASKEDYTDEVYNFITQLSAQENTAAYNYAKTCYAATADDLSCRSYSRPRIVSKTSPVACPFSQNMCLESKAFEIETKSIDSAVDLGINGREEHRILYDRRLTCAPLVTDGYRVAVPDAQGRVESWRYYYGPVDAWYPGQHNWTIEISAMPPDVNVTYLTDARDNSMRDTSWLPLDSLSTGNGDVTIIFIQHNNVIHQTANNDPVFRANVSFRDWRHTVAKRLISAHLIASVLCLASLHIVTARSIVEAVLQNPDTETVLLNFYLPI